MTSCSMRRPKRWTFSSCLSRETASSVTSSMVVVLAPPAVEPGLPPVSMSRMVSRLPAPERSPVGTVSKPAVLGVTAPKRLASRRSPVLMPTMELRGSKRKNSPVGRSTSTALESSTTREWSWILEKRKRQVTRSSQTKKPRPPTRISAMTTKLTSGSARNSSSEENGPETVPIRSKPALQKAETEWNTL